jgi:hypothetical protein
MALPESRPPVLQLWGNADSVDVQKVMWYREHHRAAPR